MVLYPDRHAFHEWQHAKQVPAVFVMPRQPPLFVLFDLDSTLQHSLTRFVLRLHPAQRSLRFRSEFTSPGLVHIILHTVVREYYMDGADLNFSSLNRGAACPLATNLRASHSLVQTERSCAVTCAFISVVVNSVRFSNIPEQPCPHQHASSSFMYVPGTVVLSPCKKAWVSSVMAPSRISLWTSKNHASMATPCWLFQNGLEQVCLFFRSLALRAIPRQV